jgi:hypothetical protein
MDRYNAFTIEVTDWSNSEFWKLLSEISGEDCLFDQPDLKKDGIFWLENIPKELFKYSDCFNWLSGSVHLWIDEKPLTRFNYRTAVYENEELDHYDYIDFSKLTNIAPIVEEII